MPTIKLLKRKRDNVRSVRKGIYQDVYQDKRWLNLRNHKRRVNPLCERCMSLNKITPMDQVHHKIPFDTGKTKDEVEKFAFDWDNLESVCEPCHKIRHKELSTNC